MNNSSTFQSRYHGVTLIELAMCMMILGILSVAVSNLVLAGVQGQMNQRNEETMQLIAYNIIDDIRLDMKRAQWYDIPGGDRLDLVLADGTVVQYRLIGTTMQRSAGGPPKLYNNQVTPAGVQAYSIACTPCFRRNLITRTITEPGPPVVVTVNTISHEVRMDNLTVQRINNGAGTIVDNNFGAPAFRVSNTAFDVMPNNTFQ